MKSCWSCGDTSFPAGYFTYLSGDLSTVQLSLYFPDKNAEYVHLEKRDVLVADGQTARAAVEELISGPRVSGLNLQSLPAQGC